MEADAYKAYTRNNIEDSIRVSRKLVVATEGNETRPGKGLPEVGNDNYSSVRQQ